jgi:Adenylate and Guanylate cyclase catalytic domain
MWQHAQSNTLSYNTRSGDTKLVEETKLWAEFNRNFIGPNEVPMEPMTDLVFPVIDTIDQVRVAGAADYNPKDHKAVGVLTGNIYWRSMIRNILPKSHGSNGIHVVFTNPCTKAFTYQINGPNVKYLGVGDHHEHHFNSRSVQKKIHKLGASALHHSAYTGAQLDEEYCPVTLHLYPSDEMRAAFETHNPALFSGVVLLIFAFVSLVFIFYDRKVHCRQVLVMDTAVRSTAIVSSLFPAEVRDRLYPATNGKSPTGAPETAKGKLHKFLHETQKTANATLENETNLVVGVPIAELYPETTVLFADISGFTAWSSERHPTQVFHLLETVYAAFDAIAKARGVFKVETIGDCYLAVVGLPTSRKHHAVVMARFARDCRDKMAKITEELTIALGPVRTFFMCEALIPLAWLLMQQTL